MMGINFLARFLAVALVCMPSFFAQSFYPYPFISGVNVWEAELNGTTLHSQKLDLDIAWNVISVINDSNGTIVGLRFMDAPWGTKDVYFGVNDGYMEPVIRHTYAKVPPWVNIDDRKLAETVMGVVNGEAGIGICSAVPSNPYYYDKDTYWTLYNKGPNSYAGKIEDAFKYFGKQYLGANWSKVGIEEWKIWKN